MSVADVSVIMVVKNGEKYLATSIESVLNQSIPPAEIILVDGGSTDKTRRIASKYHQVKILIQKDEGLANARNLGIKSARTGFVSFLDHDDYWPDTKLELQIEACLKNPDVMYSYGQVQLFYDHKPDLRFGYDAQDFKVQKKGRTPGTLFARKSLFDRVGGFNPNYSIACDVDWFTRVAECEINHVFIPKILLYKRVHPLSLSTNVAQNRMELFQVIKSSLKRQQNLNKNKQ